VTAGAVTCTAELVAGSNESAFGLECEGQHRGVLHIRMIDTAAITAARVAVPDVCEESDRSQIVGALRTYAQQEMKCWKQKQKAFTVCSPPASIVAIGPVT